ncbi:probable rRNA-processing protein EBP2 [Uloborus diversus]|uniref:probable rRNA-processing protein EBP2 n=1 Tax=Uloborus diversus TaxID=327109 RepID=UPI0024099505|nr:probable rRNA-processing protein EBP2 [Uloborus diversus]
MIHPRKIYPKLKHPYSRRFCLLIMCYNQASVAASKALIRLKGLGIPTKRPNDYLAEMAKSDAHMVKVREKLLSKQAAIERTDKIREIREQKKLGKKVQIEVMEQKKMEKKKMMNALKKAKKGKMSAENLLNEDKRGIGKKRRGKKFREFKNDKYGYGGKKKYSKWNTSESSSHFPGEEKEREKKKLNIDKRHKFKPRGKKRPRKR